MLDYIIIFSDGNTLPVFCKLVILNYSLTLKKMVSTNTSHIFHISLIGVVKLSDIKGASLIDDNKKPIVHECSLNIVNKPVITGNFFAFSSKNQSPDLIFTSL